MLDAFKSYLEARSGSLVARDVVDVLLVYYVLYRALLVLKGTRALQVSIGLGMVFVLYVATQVLQLVTLGTVVGALITNIILVIVVVFANDIRRGLQRVGSGAWFGGLAREQESAVIEEVVDAATELARHRIGAIITFEQDANLDEFVGAHTGHVVDARVTQELLVSLFIPEGINKLHDGAVIIRNLRIAKAGVFFPMPEGRVVDPSFGSRHRAALGITEETDAVVVVVSEERGTISFCFNGNIASNLDGPKLKTMLEAIFSPKVRKKSRRAAARRASQAPAEAERISVPQRTEEPRPRVSMVSITEAEATPVARISRIPSEPDVTPLRPRRTSEPPPPPPLRRGQAEETPRVSAPSNAVPPPPLLGESRPMPRAQTRELTSNPEIEDAGSTSEPESRDS
jgi:uncharacterized protein (TIGR00159 family)